MSNNVDFTNERPYDQYEHARALKSACANRVDGMNYSNGRIESGYGIIFGSPFQTDATNISGSGYITVNISLSEQGQAGVGDVYITLNSTRENMDNGTLKKYSVYKVDGTKITEDYRYSDIIKDLEISGAGNKFQFRINGVKSNYYTLPLSSSGNVDLSNYYTKAETAQQIRSAKIDYEFSYLGNPANGNVSFNPKDYNFILIGHYDNVQYINYMRPIYLNQFNTTNNTTYSFGDIFFTEASGDLAQTWVRLNLRNVNTTNATASISAYRVQIGGSTNYTGYKPNKLIGVKMVVK